MSDEMAENRVTNQDIDRRVGRLEEVQTQQGDRLHELGNQVNLIGLKQEHSEKLFSSKFDQVFTRLDRIIERTERDSEGFSDMNASVMGRTVKERLDGLEAGRQSNAARIEKLEGTALKVAGALGLIGFLAPWLVPLIVGWLGLPK